MKVLKSFIRQGLRYKPGDDAPSNLDAETMKHYERNGMLGAAPAGKASKPRTTRTPTPANTQALAPSTSETPAPGHSTTPAPDNTMAAEATVVTAAADSSTQEP